MSVMSEGLPRFVPDRFDSVREEAAEWRSLTDEERIREVRACCRAARRWLAYHPDPGRALGFRDPLPESSERALARLRAQYRDRRRS
jgi:hypothetical protein